MGSTFQQVEAIARDRLDGWLILAVAAMVLAFLGATDAVWRAFHGDFGGLLLLPWVLLFWSWIAGGSLKRRARRVGSVPGGT